MSTTEKKPLKNCTEKTTTKTEPPTKKQKIELKAPWCVEPPSPELKNIFDQTGQSTDLQSLRPKGLVCADVINQYAALVNDAVKPSILVADSFLYSLIVKKRRVERNFSLSITARTKSRLEFEKRIKKLVHKRGMDDQRLKYLLIPINYLSCKETQTVGHWAFTPTLFDHNNTLKFFISFIISSSTWL